MATYIKPTLTDLINDYITTEEEAEDKISEKGSEDAMLHMPVSDCSKAYIKSATAVKTGENYVVTIVMKEQVNPSYDDNDGLGRMSKDFLDYKDVQDTVENDKSLSYIRDIDGDITYKDYTIKATMNDDGQVIKIEHYGTGNIDVFLELSYSWADVNGSLDFNAKYYDFIY